MLGAARDLLPVMRGLIDDLTLHRVTQSTNAVVQQANRYIDTQAASTPANTLAWRPPLRPSHPVPATSPHLLTPSPSREAHLLPTQPRHPLPSP